MADKIVFVNNQAGVPTDATSVVFEDADASYGILEKATLTTVLAAGTAIPKTSTGTYKYDFSGESWYSTSKEYEFFIKVVALSATYHLRGFIDKQPEAETTPSALSSYRLTYDEIRQVVGDLTYDPNNERYSTADVYAAINKAQMLFAVLTHQIKDNFLVVLNDGDVELNLRSLAAVAGREYIWVDRVGFSGETTLALQPTSMDSLDTEGLIYYQGAPYRFHNNRVDYGLIELYPETLSETTLTLDVSYFAYPEYVYTDYSTSYPDGQILATYHESLGYCAAGLLLMEETDSQLLNLGLSYFNTFQVVTYQARSDTMDSLTERYGATPL